jgi:hypothetical protein
MSIGELSGGYMGIRERLEATLRRTLSDQVWNLLEEDSFVEEVERGEFDDSFERLVERARKLLR